MFFLRVPADLAFPALSRDPVTGDVEFDTGPLQRIADENPFLRLDDEETVSLLMIAWYNKLHAGGYTDPVMEQLRAEVQAEDRFGAWRVQFVGGKSQ